MRSPLLVSTVILCCARAAAAEVAPKSAPPADARPPIFAPKAAVKQAPAPRPRLPSSGARTSRAISPEMGKKLAEMAERVAPPSATGAPRPVATPPVADGSSDAVMLDPFEVNEDRTPKLRERQLLTPKQILELAHRLNPGLKLGRLPLGNDALALELGEAELEKLRHAELRELNSVLTVGGQKAPPAVQRKIDEALTRNNGWLEQKPGTPFREPR